MPAKQVYGKRATAKTTNAFMKFISPDKDVMFVSEQKKAVEQPTRAKIGNESEDKVELIEKRLCDLSLGSDEAILSKGMKEKCRRPRRVVEDDEDDVQDVEKAANVINLTDEMNALALNKHGIQPQPKETQRGRQRKALEPADDNVRPNMGGNKQTTVSQKPTKQQPAPSTPVRGRKLKTVVVPKRVASPKMSSLPTPEPTPEPDDSYSAYVSPLLSLSSGKRIVSFGAWSSALEPHFEVTKIAEASFSEVYRLTATSTTFSITAESVLKLVALKTPPNAPLSNNSRAREARETERQAKREQKAREERDQWKSHVDDVHSEVKLLQNLNQIPGFTNFRELTVLQGRPSPAFISAWKAWNKTRPRGKKSEFPDPSKRTSYDDTQLWAVVEMQDAGTDCEKVMDRGGLSTVWEIWDVFWGVCLSVAKAEKTCKFEHRDLHLENICIRSSRSRSDNDLIAPCIKDPLRRKLGFTGLDTTVIDYTLSRADILPSFHSTPSTPISNPSTSSLSDTTTPPPSREVAYLDLNKDPSLFTGDAEEEYQYEIYRYMRGAVLYNDPLQTTPPSTATLQIPGTPRRSPRKTPQHIRFDSSPPPPIPPLDIWRSFHPKTNLLWTHFILYKLLSHLDGAEPAQLTSKQHMRNVEARIEDADRVGRRAQKLYKVLERVKELLEPAVLRGEGALGSVGDLVVMAIEERWLRVEDVAG
jgi:serine/threonine-protein kinase haspin